MASTGNSIETDTFTTSTSSVELIGRSDKGDNGFARSVAIQNIDASAPFYIGGDTGLTAANGYRIAAGESITLDLMFWEVLHVIAPAGTPEGRYLIMNV